MDDQKNYSERYFLRLLQYGPFERRARGGWRFGTKVITDAVVERLLAGGRAEIVGLQLRLKPPASSRRTRQTDRAELGPRRDGAAEVSGGGARRAGHGQPADPHS